MKNTQVLNARQLTKYIYLSGLTSKGESYLFEVKLIDWTMTGSKQDYAYVELMYQYSQKIASGELVY